MGSFSLRALISATSSSPKWYFFSYGSLTGAGSEESTGSTGEAVCGIRDAIAASAVLVRAMGDAASAVVVALATDAAFA